MNLTRALEVALPEIPARVIAQSCPRLHPDAVFKEHIVDGRPTVRVFVPGVDAMFNLSPETWEVVRFFDGQRNFEQVAGDYTRETGKPISLDDVYGIADDLESIEFWHKTAREKNIALMQLTADERRSRQKQTSKWRDLAFIKFPAFNPDSFMVWLERRIRFVFTWWFTLLTLAAFACMATIFVLHWSEVGRDTLQFFNFADKTWWDVAAFWGITLVLAAIHEAAHGVVCRHFGGRVSSMGFALVYLTPCFYTDTTEGVVLCGPFERILISLAGVWSEMYICVVATIVWWGTPPATPVHDFAYVMMLMTGIATALLNWNPLMKLDGYHMLCDMVGVLDLKENSTAYTSAWVKKHVWRLPVEVPYVPKRRRFGFVVYAIASGLYSYTVLFILARFVGNVFRNFNPEWSFIPELATGALIFRSRIRSAVNFMKFVYLDKKDRVWGWLTSHRVWWAAAAVLVLLFLPLWHDSVEGRFLLQPANQAIIRAETAGTVERVNATEGQSVPANATLVQLRNVPLESREERGQAELRMAASALKTAELRHAGTGEALQKWDQLEQENRILNTKLATLEIRSPIAGVVATPRLNDLLGSYVTEGTEIAQVADMGTMRARIYVSEYEMYKYRPGAIGVLKVDGMFGKWESAVLKISPASSEIEPGLIDPSKFKGMRPPTFYPIDLFMNNADGRLKPGMAGTARIYCRRRSMAGLAFQSMADFAGRKLW